MDTLFSNVTIVTMNEKMDVLLGSYLGVTDGKISYIAKVPPKQTPASIIDGTGMVLLPGLINCHTIYGSHSGLFRIIVSLQVLYLQNRFCQSHTSSPAHRIRQTQPDTESV